MSPIPEIPCWSVIVYYRLTIWFCERSMSKSTWAYDEYIIVWKIKSLNTFSHFWKTEFLSFCEIISLLTWKRETTWVDIVSWKYLSNLCFIIDESVEIRIGKYICKFFYNFFCSSEFYKHFMEYCDFHSFVCISDWWHYIFFCLFRKFSYYFKKYNLFNVAYASIYHQDFSLICLSQYSFYMFYTSSKSGSTSINKYYELRLCSTYKHIFTIMNKWRNDDI